MLVFATCVGSAEKYERYARPGLRRAAELDSLIVETSSETSLHEAYNEILDAVAELPGVEALVLLHEDTEILDTAFCDHVRRSLGSRTGVEHGRRIDHLRVRSSRQLASLPCARRC